jgi:hypothetical protein
VNSGDICVYMRGSQQRRRPGAAGFEHESYYIPRDVTGRGFETSLSVHVSWMHCMTVG